MKRVIWREGEKKPYGKYTFCMQTRTEIHLRTTSTGVMNKLTNTQHYENKKKNNEKHGTTFQIQHQQQ